MENPHSTITTYFLMTRHYFATRGSLQHLKQPARNSAHHSSDFVSTSISKKEVINASDHTIFVFL